MFITQAEFARLTGVSRSAIKQAINKGLITAITEQAGKVLINKAEGLAQYSANSRRQKNKTKPNPEVFLRAASLLSTKPEKCLVIEDSIAGVEAGVAAGMKVLAIGSARIHPSAIIKAKSLSRISYSTLVQPKI